MSRQNRRVFNCEGTDEIKKNYNSVIELFADEMARNHIHNKRLLIITGSGISSDVPSTDGMMSELIKIMVQSQILCDG